MSGLVEKAIGKVKEIAGEVRNRPDLKREGELHQTKVEAEREASRRKAEADRAQSEAEVTARERGSWLRRRRSSTPKRTPTPEPLRLSASARTTAGV